MSKDEHALDYEVMTLMAAAFDQAIHSLLLTPPKLVQELMAQRIIEAVQEGERSLDKLTRAALGWPKAKAPRSSRTRRGGLGWLKKLGSIARYHHRPT